MDEDSPFRVIQIIPGDGWMISRKDGDQEWSQPVVCWALRANGTVVVLDTNDGGFADTPHFDKRHTIWHPDSSSREARDCQTHHRNQLGTSGS